MTTYILHGGETSEDHPENDAFFTEFTDNVSNSIVNVLMCYWSRPKEKWQELFQRDSLKVINHSNKETNFHIVEDSQDLLTQLPNFDVLYVAGGDAEPIERFYHELTALKEALNNKVFIGSSMGAFLASSNYVLSLSDQEENEVHSGIGLLPLNSLCHWNVEDKKQIKLDLLKQHSPTLPILTLDEHKYVKIIY